jgi:hypothetical protein
MVMLKIPSDIRTILLSYMCGIQEVGDSTLGVLVAQENDHGEIESYPQIVLTSQNELWEITDAASYGGGGSLCGNGQDPKWLFEWDVIDRFPAGAFEQMLALPQAIEAERQQRLKARRGIKRFNDRVRMIALDYVDRDNEMFELVQNSGWSAVLRKL